MAEIGQKPTLENLLHSCRSIQGMLQSGHSIEAIDFSGVNFVQAAIAEVRAEKVGGSE